MPFDGLPQPYADLTAKHGFIPANHEAPAFFPVEVRKIYDETGFELKGHKRIVRTDTNKTLAVHSDSYNLITNEDAFGAFENALAASTLDKAGMMVGTDFANGGARVFRQYLLPAHMVQVKKGVDVALRLLMFNSYDGTMAFRGQCGAFNFVCANTSISGKEFASFRLKHAGDFDLQKTVQGLAAAAEHHLVETRRFATWADFIVSDEDALAVFNSVPSASDAIVNALSNAWLRAKTGSSPNDGDTLWALFNVLTAWATHTETAKGGKSGRFDREGKVQKVIEGKVFRELADAAA